MGSTKGSNSCGCCLSLSLPLSVGTGKHDRPVRAPTRTERDHSPRTQTSTTDLPVSACARTHVVVFVCRVYRIGGGGGRRPCCWVIVGLEGAENWVVMQKE